MGTDQVERERLGGNWRREKMTLAPDLWFQNPFTRSRGREGEGGGEGKATGRFAEGRMN